MELEYETLSYEYTWWEGDSLPTLSSISSFQAICPEELPLLARITGLDKSAIEARLAAGHRAYVALLDHIPAAYGWVGTKQGVIEERNLEWPLPPADRHLWNFVTLESWRGRGIYPQLLQAILRRESGEGQRFWIGHAASNTASQRGITKAGFQLAVLGVRTTDGAIRLVPQGDLARALAHPMAQALPFLQQPEG